MKNVNILNMKIYTFLLPFTLGVFLAVFIYQAFTIYQLRSVVASDHAAVNQIVGFLNTQIQAAQGTTGTKTTSTASGTSTKK